MKLRLIESFIATARHSYSRAKYHGKKAPIGTATHPEFCQIFKMELFKLVAAVIYFRKTLHFRSMHGYAWFLNIPEYVSI